MFNVVGETLLYYCQNAKPLGIALGIHLHCESYVKFSQLEENYDKFSFQSHTFKLFVSSLRDLTIGMDIADSSSTLYLPTFSKILYWSSHGS